MVEFKKRKVKPRGSLRKKRAVEEDIEDEADNASTTDGREKLELLAELRNEQRDRRRAVGLSSSKLLAISEDGLRKREKKREEEEKGLQDEAAGPDLKELMTNQFTGQIGQGQDGGKAHEQRMEEFIEEQMTEKMGIKKEKDQSNESAEDGSQAMTEEDKLYLIPDEFKSKPRDVGDDGTFNKREGFSGEAAPLFMNTGIAEVSLPLDFRLRNIQKTDEARAKLVGSGGGRYFMGKHRHQRKKDGDAKEFKGSMNSNFNQHQRDWAAMMDKKRRAQMESGGPPTNTGAGGGAGGQQAGNNTEWQARSFRPNNGRSAATDDAVYERYKKRSRR